MTLTRKCKSLSGQRHYGLLAIYIILFLLLCFIRPRPIISRVLYAHNCLQPGLYVFYTMVTQKYAIKSHLTSLLSSRNHSTMLISVYCKNCENTIR